MPEHIRHREAAGAGRPAALYARLRPGPHGSERDHEQVLRHQRMRLFGAMVAAAYQRGYEAVSVQQLVTLAGVSKRSFYEHFSCKEECFLATFDSIVLDVQAQLTSPAEPALDARGRLGHSLAALLGYVDSHPREARLCLTDTSTPAPAVRERMRRTLRDAECAIARACSSAPPQPPQDGFRLDECAPAELVLPSIARKAVVHGLRHLICSRLRHDDCQSLAGRESLACLADELCDWVLSYRCPAHTLPAPPPAVGERVIAPSRPPAGDERRRLQRAALEIAGRRGWMSLRRESLVSLADVSDSAFSALYEDVDQCFLDGLDLLAVEVLARMRNPEPQSPPTASERSPSWPAVVQRSIVALLELFAVEPALARVACAEALCAGPAALTRLERLLNSFAGFLCRSAPPDRRPSPAVAQAIVGAVWGILHDYVEAQAFAQLGQLAGQLSFVVLAPTSPERIRLQETGAAFERPDRPAVLAAAGL